MAPNDQNADVEGTIISHNCMNVLLNSYRLSDSLLLFSRSNWPVLAVAFLQPYKAIVDSFLWRYQPPLGFISSKRLNVQNSKVNISYLNSSSFVSVRQTGQILVWWKNKRERSKWHCIDRGIFGITKETLISLLREIM